jgi:nitrogen regulatory protein P-II 1
MTQEMVVLTDAMMITCIVQRGVAETVLKAAQQAGARGATIFHARGTGIRQRLGVLGITVNAEKEVVCIVVASEQADYMFEQIYAAAKLDTPGMGMMYLTQIEKMATYVPADIAKKFAR